MAEECAFARTVAPHQAIPARALQQASGAGLREHALPATAATTWQCTSPAPSALPHHKPSLARQCAARGSWPVAIHPDTTSRHQHGICSAPALPGQRDAAVLDQLRAAVGDAAASEQAGGSRKAGRGGASARALHSDRRQWSLPQPAQSNSRACLKFSKWISRTAAPPDEEMMRCVMKRVKVTTGCRRSLQMQPAAARRDQPCPRLAAHLCSAPPRSSGPPAPCAPPPGAPCAAASAGLPEGVPAVN